MAGEADNSNTAMISSVRAYPAADFVPAIAHAGAIGLSRALAAAQMG